MAKVKKQPAGENEESPAAVLYKIEGEGSVPVFVDGEMHRIPAGTPVTLNIGEAAYLDRAGVKYARV